jgi:integrase
LREVLKRRFAQRGNSKFVFTGWSDEGEDAPRGKATGAIRRALGRSGANDEAIVARFGKATVHTLRDTFATKLYRDGMELGHLSKLLGHSSVTQTEKYAHADEERAAREAATRLNAMAARRTTAA